MRKDEQAQMEAMCLFISNLYNSCGLEVPEVFEAEIESMIIYNAIRRIGRNEMCVALLKAEKDGERDRLNALIQEAQ